MPEPSTPDCFVWCVVEKFPILYTLFGDFLKTLMHT